MIKAVVFDLYETLITEWASDKYTSNLCAADLGVDHDLYRNIWEACHKQMDIGTYNYRQVLIRICEAAGVTPDQAKLDLCESKRIASKNQCFVYRHDEIMKMLEEIKAAGIKLALCSNCSLDEVFDFNQSDLEACFDAAVFSYATGLAKPDERMYRLCAEKLGVLTSECLYVGDGGSRELYGAQAAGMKPLRAMWFISQSAKAIEAMPFSTVDKPEMILQIIIGLNSQSEI